jgi:hypothetical protein
MDKVCGNAGQQRNETQINGDFAHIRASRGRSDTRQMQHSEIDGAEDTREIEAK